MIFPIKCFYTKSFRLSFGRNWQKFLTRRGWCSWAVWGINLWPHQLNVFDTIPTTEIATVPGPVIVCRSLQPRSIFWPLSSLYNRRYWSSLFFSSFLSNNYLRQLQQLSNMSDYFSGDHLLQVEPRDHTFFCFSPPFLIFPFHLNTCDHFWFWEKEFQSIRRFSVSNQFTTVFGIFSN